ncbi:MAG: peptidase M13, partial [Cutibacterium granulosum]|nr:peptidase M13 [Cutibacterium granulosum]
MAEPFLDRDESIRPGDDLYQHVNGAWERVTEIPSDQASTGSFRGLRDNSEAAVHQILADLSSGGATQLRTLAPE